MMMKNLPWIILLGLLAACSNLNTRNQVDRLHLQLNAYGADLRWGRYSQAYKLHRDQHGNRIEVDLEQLEKYSVTSFRPVDPVVNDDGTEAVIPVEIDYYDEQYGDLRKIKTTQRWWLNKEEKIWYIESDFPVFK
jgi:hypothetical protein